MNDFVLRYGEKAVQTYKKSVRLSDSLQMASPIKQQHHHLLPKKSFSKKSLKQSSLKRHSKSNLHHSKSKLSCSKHKNIDSAFNENNQKQSNVQLQSSCASGFTHTFNKNQQNKKKLVLSNVQTPKACTPSKVKAKDVEKGSKNTLRLGDCHRNQCNRENFSNKKTQRDMRRYKSIQKRLARMVNEKMSTQNLVQESMKCIQNIGMQNQNQLNDLCLLLKKVINKIGKQTFQYREKLKRANLQIKQLKNIQLSYLEPYGKNSYQKSENYDIQSLKTRANQSFSKQEAGENFESKVDLFKPKSMKGHSVYGYGEAEKKASKLEVAMMKQNYELRKRIKKLQKEVEYYSNQEASLMNVFGKYKNSDSQLRIGKELRHLESEKNQVPHPDLKQLPNKMPSNRRSSENLLHHQEISNQIDKAEKRLSFDVTDSSQNAGFHAKGYLQQSNLPTWAIRQRLNDLEKAVELEELSEEEDSHFEE